MWLNLDQSGQGIFGIVRPARINYVVYGDEIPKFGKFCVVYMTRHVMTVVAFSIFRYELMLFHILYENIIEHKGRYADTT